VPAKETSAVQDKPKDPPPVPVPAPDGEFVEVVPPQSAKVAGIQLPANQEITSKKRFVLVKATTDNANQQVKWLVLGSVANSQPTVLASPTGKQILVFPNDHADLITVLAWSAVGGSPTDAAVTQIKVNGPPPPTPTPPNPPTPTPTLGKLHVTVIMDFSAMTTDLASLRSSKSFRDGLTAADCEYHEFDVSGVPADMQPLVTKVGGAPAVIIQNSDGDVVEKARITNAAGVLTLVNNLRGAK
jgi:hypothetical protein